MEAGFYVAQCASAGVDDLVPVKRSFVDAARPGPSLLESCGRPCYCGGLVPWWWCGPTVVAVPPGQAAFKEAVDDFGPDNADALTAADTSYRSTPAQLKCIAHECSTLHCNRLLNCNSSSMKAGSNAQLKTASGFITMQ